MQRDRVSRFQIFQPAAGIGLRGADGRITYDFDELCLELVDAEPVDGWAGSPSGNTVTVDLVLSGNGVHQLLARAFNPRVAGPPAQVDLDEATTVMERLSVNIEDPSMPWLLTVIPDERIEGRTDISGTASPLRPIA
jgi:hypothetical protein